MSDGPGSYTVKDLAFWGGLIAGTICTHLTLVNLPAYHDMLGQLGLADWGRVITLIVSLMVGGALGAACERTWRSYQRYKKSQRVYDDSEGFRDGDPLP